MQPDEAVTGAESEALWLRRIASGDRRAFEQLYHAYQRRVAAYLFRLLGDADAVGEVTNDVMVTVWKEAKRFEGRSKPSTWIFGHRTPQSPQRAASAGTLPCGGS